MDFGALATGFVNAGASMWGTKKTNEANRDIAREANAMSQANSREQMSFQERMSNTSYQRAMQDMKQAGLNPMLAYQQGGASSPVGAQGSVTTGAPMQNEIGPGVEAGINSALETRRLRKDVELATTQGELNKEGAITQKTQQKLNQSNARSSEQQAAALKAQMPAIQAKAKAEAKTAKINEGMAETDAVLSRTNQVTSALGNLLPLRHLLPGGASKKDQDANYTTDRFGNVYDKKTGQISPHKYPHQP